MQARLALAALAALLAGSAGARAQFFGLPGIRCDAYYRTPYGLRSLKCPLVREQPPGTRCACVRPSPPGAGQVPAIPGRAIP